MTPEQVAALVAELTEYADEDSYTRRDGSQGSTMRAVAMRKASDALTALAAEREHLAAATRGMLQEIETLRKRAEAAEQALALLVNSPPAQMTTPLGLLPVNADGMRTLVDHINGLEACRQDAERYRWLRKHRGDCVGTDDCTAFDAEVDQAMKGTS
jgi:hypothetical protein